MTTILGFLKAKKLIIIYGLVASFIVGFSIKAYNHIYNEGYNKRISEYQAAYDLELQTQQKEYDRKLSETIKLMKEENKAALKRQEAKTEIALRTETVVRYVDKIVVKTECNDLAADVVWLLSESTETINNEAERSTESNYKF